MKLTKTQRSLKKYIQKKSTIISEYPVLDYRPVKRRSKEHTIKKYITNNFLDINNRHGCCIILNIGTEEPKNIALINLGFKYESCSHAELLRAFYNDETKEKADTRTYENKDRELFKRDSYLSDSPASYAHLLLKRNNKNGRIYAILLFEGDWSEHNYNEIKAALSWWNIPKDGTKSTFDFECFGVTHSYKDKYSRIYHLQNIPKMLK